jgi:formate hydrogenlyase subunit 4
VPLGGHASPLAFSGDLLAAIYFLGLMRFITVLAALDTGSAFEGMGSSREVQFSALAEPVLLLSLATVAKITGTWSLSEMYSGITAAAWAQAGESLILVMTALLIVFLAENARIPFDDPATHLELTMIHEVMILDHGGPDLAFLEFANAVKFWTLGVLLAGVAVPVRTGNAWLDAAACIAGLFVLAVIVGCIESITARLRLLRVPQMLVGAMLIAALGMFVFIGGEMTT